MFSVQAPGESLWDDKLRILITIFLVYYSGDLTTRNSKPKERKKARVKELKKWMQTQLHKLLFISIKEFRILCEKARCKISFLSPIYDLLSDLHAINVLDVNLNFSRRCIGSRVRTLRARERETGPG